MPGMKLSSPPQVVRPKNNKKKKRKRKARENPFCIVTYNPIITSMVNSGNLPKSNSCPFTNMVITSFAPYELNFHTGSQTEIL